MNRMYTGTTMERVGVAFAKGLSPTEVVECVQLAEELGYESAWMAEGHGGDQFSILTACALATKTILLGTSISSIFVRSAPTIAMAAACVDYFSGGRFILGLGTSHKVQVEPAHGLTFSHPVPRLKEYIEIIRMLLREGSVSYSGSVTNIERFDLWFEPVRRELPIYTSALFPKMLQISGEIAQGVLLNWCTLEYANSATEHVALGARRVGKDPHEVDVATLLSCAVVANRADTDKTRDSMRSTIASYAGRVPRYRRLMAEAGFPREMEAVHKAWNAGDIKRAIQLVPSGLIDKISIIGTPNDFRQRLQEYRQAGITLPIITPRVSGNNAKKQAIATIKAGAP